MASLRPLGDMIMLKPVDAVERSAGGLYLPDSAKERPDEGIVVAKAADATDEVAIDDRVVYKRFSGDEVKLDGETYRLVPSGDLLAVYVESDAIPD